jgi:hypothetical protein
MNSPVLASTKTTLGFLRFDELAIFEKTLAAEVGSRASACGVVMTSAPTSRVEKPLRAIFI